MHVADKLFQHFACASPWYISGMLIRMHMTFACSRRQHVTQEELFKASLVAKNEEISKINDILKEVSDELTRELCLVHKLNAQVCFLQNIRSFPVS